MIIHPQDMFPKIYQDLLDRYGREKELSISFLPKLDGRIWGLSKKQLVIVGGRTSQGKSVLLLQMAHAFASQGKKVLFFTLEMTVRTCILRLMNDYCGIDNWANISGISPEEHNVLSHKIKEFHDHLDTLDLVFIEGHGKTFKEINDTIDKAHTDVDAVFIDYVQMISHNDKEGIDEYIKALRAMAIKKNFCAVIGSQINRGTFDSAKVMPPEMHHLKGSGALEEIADMIFLCHWKFHYSREEEDYNNFWLRIAKNREGRTGVFECKFEPEFCRLSEDDGETFKERYGEETKSGVPVFGDRSD